MQEKVYYMSKNEELDKNARLIHAAASSLLYINEICQGGQNFTCFNEEQKEFLNTYTKKAHVVDGKIIENVSSGDDINELCSMEVMKNTFIS